MNLKPKSQYTLETRTLNNFNNRHKKRLQTNVAFQPKTDVIYIYIYIYEPAAFRVYLALGFSYCFKRVNINIIIQKYIFTPTYGTHMSCPAVLGLTARHSERRTSDYSYFVCFSLLSVHACSFFSLREKLAVAVAVAGPENEAQTQNPQALSLTISPPTSTP